MTKKNQYTLTAKNILDRGNTKDRYAKKGPMKK